MINDSITLLSRPAIRPSVRPSARPPPHPTILLASSSELDEFRKGSTVLYYYIGTGARNAKDAANFGACLSPILKSEPVYCPLPLAVTDGSFFFTVHIYIYIYLERENSRWEGGREMKRNRRRSVGPFIRICERPPFARRRKGRRFRPPPRGAVSVRRLLINFDYPPRARPSKSSAALFVLTPGPRVVRLSLETL